MQINNIHNVEYKPAFNGLFKKKTPAFNNVDNNAEIQSSSSGSACVAEQVKAGLFSRAKMRLQNMICHDNSDLAQVRRINNLEEVYSNLSDKELRVKTKEFKEILTKRKTSLDPVKDLQLEKEALDLILPDAYAVVREAAKRVFDKRAYDVQLLGGIAIHNGEIAEMATGEGKTLTAAFPAYLNALTGKGVHVITANDYLAKRDAKEMCKLYSFLGLSTGLVTSTDRKISNKKIAYNRDITYGTNVETAFDYLRDNMAKTPDGQVQRPFYYAIVDEVDSILIDRAVSSVLLCGEPDEPEELCTLMADTASKLTKDIDYEADKKNKTILLTEEGMEKAQEILGVDDLFNDKPTYAFRLLQALKAKEFFHCDNQYIVKDGKIVIVDEFTGRAMPNSQWTEGINAAVAAKEGLKIPKETNVNASITCQNFFRMYPRLSGITGTASTEKEEFEKIYNLPVNKIPTNKEVQRIDFDDVICATEEEKQKAIIDEIIKTHETGRPVLVGTISIEKTEKLSEKLKEYGIKHNVLNAKNAQKEASIIAQAGRLGAVTIATNMAGRGTDILLGGNPACLTEDELKKRGITPDSTPDYEKIKKQIYNDIKKITDEEHKKVTDLGGLHVIGMEKHESRRIDNQLRGRAGRQGDKGSTVFFVCPEDKILRVLGNGDSERITDILNSDISTDEKNNKIGEIVESRQQKIESNHFASRKNLLKYDDVLNLMRSRFYHERSKILNSDDLHSNVMKMLADSVDRLVQSCIRPKSGKYSLEELEPLVEKVQSQIPQMKNLSANDIQGLTYDEICKELKKFAVEAYDEKEKALVEIYNSSAKDGAKLSGEAFSSKSIMREYEKNIMLQSADDCWLEYLHDLSVLRKETGLLKYGKKNPFQEYQISAFEMFEKTMQDIQDETVKQLFEVKPEPLQ